MGKERGIRRADKGCPPPADLYPCVDAVLHRITLLTVKFTVKRHPDPYASCYLTHVTYLAIHDDSCFIRINKSTLNETTMSTERLSAIPSPGTT